MDSQEFTLHDGKIAVQVKGDGTNITLDFDTTDSSHTKPVIDMVKFGHAGTVAEKIRKAWEVIAGSGIPEATLGKEDSHLHLTATFKESGQYENALAVVRSALAPTTPAVSAAPPPPPTRPPSSPPNRIFSSADPLPVEIVPETASSLSFLHRLQEAEEEARGKRTLKSWRLDDEPKEIMANVFPINQSLVTGMLPETGMEDAKLVAVRLRAGRDTHEARTEIHRLTNEVEKLLLTRGLEIKRGGVYLGTADDGTRDTGVILLPASQEPTKTIATINEVLAHVQEEMPVLRAKLGRGRGEDHRQRRPIPQEPDAVELELAASLRAAAHSGLLTVNGNDAALGKWVKETATRLRNLQQSPESLPEPGYGNRGT